MTADVDEEALRDLVPAVIGVLCARGAEFSDAEDAVQEALIAALSAWSASPPDDPRAWLITVAWRRHLDLVRSRSARTDREFRAAREELGPADGAVASAREDTLDLFVLCAHPDLSPASAVALTLRAVGGLTTTQIAAAFLVPEATMAQRISRAKRAIAGTRLNRPGDLGAVLTVLYLVFNEGYTGEIDLAVEAIRLTRRLTDLTDDAKAAGLLALMLIHHARRPARFGPGGRLVPLAEQDRRLWDTDSIAEGIGLLQAALARDRLGEFQAQAAIAAVHADALRFEDTDWPQIVSWYDELLALRENPVARLARAVAVGEADGAQAGLADLADCDETLPRFDAAHAHLRELAGDDAAAVELYAQAAEKATTVGERDHLLRQAARLNAGARSGEGLGPVEG